MVGLQGRERLDADLQPQLQASIYRPMSTTLWTHVHVYFQVIRQIAAKSRAHGMAEAIGRSCVQCSDYVGF